MAAQHHRHGRLYVLAGYRPESLALSPRYAKQGYDLNLLPYRSPVFPLGTLYAFAVCLVVALGQNTEAVFNGDWLGVLATYIGILIFVGIWLGYRLTHPEDRLVRYEDMEFSARFAELKARR